MRKETLKNALFQKLQAEDYETAFWKLLSVLECGELPCSRCPIAVSVGDRKVCARSQLMEIEKRAKKEEVENA
jgi:hypothetical protein